MFNKYVFLKEKYCFISNVEVDLDYFCISFDDNFLLKISKI